MDEIKPTEHQVGITPASENNPNIDISRLTREMREYYQQGKYIEAVRSGFKITELGKDELRRVFEAKRIKIIQLDHEAFGIYQNEFEPTYDLLVDGKTADIVAAAKEFGENHAQQAILVAKLHDEGEDDEESALGVTLTLGSKFTITEAVEMADTITGSGFSGATFAPNRNGTVIIYHTVDLAMNEDQFNNAADSLANQLRVSYPTLDYEIRKYMLELVNLK